jgi:hypothetical protein
MAFSLHIPLNHEGITTMKATAGNNRIDSIAKPSSVSRFVAKLWLELLTTVLAAAMGIMLGQFIYTRVQMASGTTLAKPCAVAMSVRVPRTLR